MPRHGQSRSRAEDDLIRPGHVISGVASERSQQGVGVLAPAGPPALVASGSFRDHGRSHPYRALVGLDGDVTHASVLQGAPHVS